MTSTLHKTTVRVYRTYAKEISGYSFPNCHYMTALGKTDQESLEQKRENQCDSFFKEIQHRKHKLHHLLPEMR